MAAKIIYPWKRYWVKHGETPTMDDGLFRDPLSGVQWFGEASNGVSLLELKDVPCLILLGDVGMGKSTTLEQEANELRAAIKGQKAAVAFFDLKRWSGDQIEKQIFHDPVVERWLAGDHSLTLFLDSLDECWRRIDVLELLLVHEFRLRIREETPPLFLRLACRSAEWRDEASEALQSLFSNGGTSKPSIEIYVLAPLSAENLRDAARRNNLDGDLFLERIVAKKAQGLASHPITLKMLLQVYAASSDFPKSRVELYKDGCLRLCADDNNRFGVPLGRRTTPEQRYSIAGRLAAMSVLSNRFLINGDAEHPLSRVDVLEIADVVGRAEETVHGDTVIVDRDTVTETLQTALFGERMDGAQTWRHQSYAEFLAADYIARCELSTGQIVALLTDTSDNSRRIVPQLEETACWAVELRQDVFKSLAEKNADIFLRCDSTYWSDQYRRLLVEHYLGLVRCHEAEQLGWQLKYRFAQLAHPGIAAQLGRVITDRRDNPLVREAAIAIAGYCKLHSLGRELVSIVFDSTDAFRVRKHAAVALWHARNDEVRELLKTRNLSDLSGDVDDDLRGYFFQILWPTHVSLTELLPLKPPQRRSYRGAYLIFLENELPKSLSDAELARMLDWLRENKISADILGAFGHLPSKLFVRALDRMNVVAVCDAVLRLLDYDELQLHHLFRGKVEPGVISAEARLFFWNAVIQSELDLQKLLSYADMHAAGMLQSHDVTPFLKQYRESVDERVRNRWRVLIFRVFSVEDAAILDVLSDLAATDVVISQELADRTSCPLVPDDRNWIKQAYERQQEQNQNGALAKPSLTQSIVHGLNAFESGAIRAFWKVGELLDTDPETMHVSLAIRLSEAKAWQGLPSEVRDRILHAIPVYLRSQRVEEVEIWDSVARYRPYDVVNPLLILLYDEHRQLFNALTAEDWGKWVSVLIAYRSCRNGSHDEAFKAMFSAASAKAHQPFVSAVQRFLKTRINNDSERLAIWHLKAVWCGELKDMFLDLFLAEPLKSTAAYDILQLLASAEPNETEGLLTSWIDEMDRNEKCSVHVPVALVVLLTSFPRTWAGALIDRISREQGLGLAVIPLLVRAYHQPSGWLSQVPPQSLAQLWEWLGHNYPGDPYENDDGEGSVTIQHEVFHFRNAVFETLRRSGTLAACDAMLELMRRNPNEFWLGDILAEMRKATHRKAWVCPSASALMRLFTKTDKRLIRTAGELHELILESIRRFESELHSSTPSAELWNETNEGGQKYWQPKDEMNLSNCVKRFLERDLKEHGLIADREVEIRPRLGGDRAQLIDILVRAIPFGEDGKPAPPVSVVVELKCAWNPGVLLDMERQLYARYLRNTDLHFGVYVVAYFWCDAWNWKADTRVGKGKNRTAIDDLKSRLSAQALALSSSEKLIRAVVIDARLNITC